jgi:hypothetical protein
MRLIPHSPLTFNGTLTELFESHILAVLPDVEEVEHIHRRLVTYINQADPSFLVRYVGGCERGEVYVTGSGARFKATDNSPAWWMHYLAFNRIRDFNLDDAPTHMFEAGRQMPGNINTAGWHVAHILNAKDRDVDWPGWARQELVRRFVRNLHPANCFYIPKPEWRGYGADPKVIGFFASRYRERYRSIWDEFVQLAEGSSMDLTSAGNVRYVYPRPEQASVRLVPGQIVASYRYSRLCFKADVIERLNPDDVFEVITPEATFRMTKAQFQAAFPNVVASKSYQQSRIYHFPKVPSAARSFLVSQSDESQSG